VSRWRDPVPGERESADRSWDVVRQAYAERLPAPRRRDRRPLVVVAVAVAALAAALSPPGLAVWGSLRDAVSNEDHLVALPSGGRVLVNARDGAWVVSADGSKRFLSDYRDAAWSPHGLYVAAVRGNQLVALEPNGKVHWKLARRGAIGDPRWSYEGYRIAYFAGGALRVVNGDGTGDRLLTRDARPGALAWEPGTHSLAYVDRAGNIAIVNVDRTRSAAHIRTRLSPRRLEWTPDSRLVAVGPRAVGIFARRGPQLSRIAAAGRITDASASPEGRRLAVVAVRNGSSTVEVDGKPVFNGAGVISDVAWSPDGRWLLLNWRGADEWLFLRTPARKLVAVSNIRGTFGDGTAVAGWCCP
jgi:WD40-like Beta Propeller Repeat